MAHPRELCTPAAELARVRARLARLEAELAPVRREARHAAADALDPLACEARLALLADRVGVILNRKDEQ